MRVATLEIDLRTGDVPGNLDAVQRGVRAAAEVGARLVAIPEMWPTSFLPDAGEADYAASDRAVHELTQLTLDYDMTVVGSAFGPRSPELPTNRAHILSRGQCLAWYDKVHLFSPTAEHLAFRAGDAPPPVVTLPDTEIPIAPMVCYDPALPGGRPGGFPCGG